ncbi:MAG: OmpA family protein [Bacteroidota bacterium]
MNGIKALLFGACLLLQVGLWAQKPNDGKNFVSAKVLFIDYSNPNSVDGDITNGLELSYRRNFGNYFSFGVPLKAGFIDVAEDMNNRNFFSIDGIVRGQIYDPMARFVPYVFAGFGYVTESDGPDNTQIPVGLGTDIRIGSNSYLNIQAEYRVSEETQRDNVQLGVGLVYKLGGMTTNPDDLDGDGVLNDEDACPELAGTTEMKGCPDRDGDGVSDLEDECADEAGTALSKGCPDKDGDGIADKDDACPETSGTLNGCPDTDEDGLADKDDECPETAGLSSLQGCPDGDGDGIKDSEDECPEVAGVAAKNGCPEDVDSDGDGVFDHEDKCPETAGTIDGCPDTDGDGVADPEDECPKLAGLIDGKGCPDTDGDGFIDKDDRCPAVKGTFGGCPDSDGDGIDDGDDKCIYNAGPVENDGCPVIKEEDKEVLAFAMRAVRFRPGSAILLRESNATLDQIAAILEKYPSYNLRIAGHTDNTGDADNNQILSEDRAQACYVYLASKGVDPTRMRFIGYGEAQPIADNSRTAGRQLNRRVEFELFIP